MAEVTLEGILERALKNVPQGRAYIPVHSLVSRTLEVIKIIDTLASRAECVAKSMGTCFKDTCKTGCASIFYKKEGGGITIWKVGSNSFSAERTAKTLKISSKDFLINIEGRKIRIKVPSREGFEIVESDFSDIRSVQKVHSEILYALNKLEPLIRNASENLLRCIRERRLSC